MTAVVPPQSPEGRLIEDAAKVSGRSVRQLAANAGISDARWRQIVRGSQPAGSGHHIPVRARSETLARMAQVVNVQPAELAAAGRPDAAELLTRMLAAGDQRPAVPGDADDRVQDEIDMIYASQSMTAQEKLEAIRKVLHLRAQAEREAPPAGGASLSRRLEARDSC